jgi:ATP-dependent DNA helicase RecQ
MLAYLDTSQCRMRYLREQLDDPEAADCGRCDNCGGLTLTTSVSEEALTTAGERLQRPGVVVEPKKMWPTGLDRLGIALKGRIPAGPEEGRAVARLTDLGHGQALRELFRVDADGRVGDGPVPVPLVRAVLEVLAEWRPSVDAIVQVESARRTTLVADLAAGLSRYLRVPVVGTFAIVDPEVEPERGAVNSAQRVAAVARRFALRADLAPGARVLLVDDLVGTGWTLTLAAKALREAGADAVLPLTLAVSG